MKMHPTLLLSITLCFMLAPMLTHADTVTIYDCNFSMVAQFNSGKVVRGSGSDITGTELVDWLHEQPEYVFETVGDPNGGGLPGWDTGLICSRAGTKKVDIYSEGTASVNGVPGYSYVIQLEDNRPSDADDPTRIRLCSTLVQRPRTRNDGQSVLTFSKTAVVPTELPVVRGSAGTGKARLTLGNVKCSYRGGGTTNYLFERCNGPGGVSLVPGDTIVVNEVSLRIVSADRTQPVTSVQVDLGTNPTPVPGGSDYYEITIGNPDGSTIFDSFIDMVQCGDIEIDLLP